MDRETRKKRVHSDGVFPIQFGLEGGKKVASRSWENVRRLFDGHFHLLKFHGDLLRQGRQAENGY